MATRVVVSELRVGWLRSKVLFLGSTRKSESAENKFGKNVEARRRRQAPRFSLVCVHAHRGNPACALFSGLIAKFGPERSHICISLLSLSTDFCYLSLSHVIEILWNESRVDS